MFKFLVNGYVDDPATIFPDLTHMRLAYSVLDRPLLSKCNSPRIVRSSRIPESKTSNRTFFPCLIVPFSPA